METNILNEEFDKRKMDLKKILALLVKPKQSNGKIAYLSKNTQFPKKNSLKFKRLNKKRKELENSLLDNNITRIVFIEDGKKIFYELGKDRYNLDGIEKNRIEKLKNLSLDVTKNDKLSTNGKTKVVNFDDYTPKLPPIKGIIGNDNDKNRFLPNKEYDMNDVVNIITPGAKFKSVYMGIAENPIDKTKNVLHKFKDETDSQREIYLKKKQENPKEKIPTSPQFEETDPFDGVFVLFTENLPKSFINKGIRIFLINEYKVGKGKQQIKAYNNSGKLVAKYNVIIDKISLLKKQEMPHKVADSLRIPTGPSLLEKINSNDFQQFINKRNESIKFGDFNTDIDFEEIK